MQIVNWRNYLKFPDEVRLSPEAKDLICRLLCNVEQRIGTKGANEIKVLCALKFEVPCLKAIDECLMNVFFWHLL